MDFALPDEIYSQCTLRLPLALRERWPGRRTFFVVPRVSATLFVKDAKGKGQWLPLAPLVNPGGDPLHLALDSAELRPSGAGGPLRQAQRPGRGAPARHPGRGRQVDCLCCARCSGEAPCATFDLTARFKVYKR